MRDGTSCGDIVTKYSIRMTCRQCDADCPCHVYLHMNTIVPPEKIADILRESFHCRGISSDRLIDPENVTITMIEVKE